MRYIFIKCSIWNTLASDIRKKIDFPIGNEKIIEDWLSVEENKKKLMIEVLIGFNKLKSELGIPDRYINFFLSCVVSHHDGGTVHHSLPWRLDRFFPVYSDGKFRVYYTPHSDPCSSWERIHPPRAFTVIWPAIQYVKLYKDNLSKIREKVKDEFGYNITWLKLPGNAYTFKDEELWYDLSTSNIQLRKEDIQDIIESSDYSVQQINTITCIPGFQIGDDLRWGRPEGFYSCSNEPPKVDPDKKIMTEEDSELADECQRIIDFLSDGKYLSTRGRKPESKYIPEPDEEYEDYLKRLYRNVLTKRYEKEHDTSSYNLRRKLWRRICKLGRDYKDLGHFPKEVIADYHWKEEVEEELPFIKTN